MRSTRLLPWMNVALVVGGGLVWGLGASRLLALLAWLRWPFYEGRLAWGLALTLGLGWAGVWWKWLRRTVPAGWSIPLYLPLTCLWPFDPSILQIGVLLAGSLLLTWLCSRSGRLSDRWIAVFLFLVALTAYLCTLTPGVGERDGYELQAISATLGFAHPTGYPLFPILGRIWLIVFPFGSLAWRINVLCALFAALSVPLVYGVARRVLDHAPAAAWSALMFAFSHTLWTQAAQPEKYTLNALFVALVLYVAFGRTDAESGGPFPHLYQLALVYGLSLTHHRTMLMLAPALAVYVLWREPAPWKQPRRWLTALGLGLAPLLIYLYIPWRAWAQGGPMSLPEFLHYISGAYYGSAVRLMDWASPERAGMFGRFLLAQFGVIGVGLGLVGLIGLVARRQWRFLLCSALAYLTYYFWGTVWYAYYNDVNSFIPNHLIWAVWMGSGVLWLARQGQRWVVTALQPDARRAAWSLLALMPLALMPLALIWGNAPQVDRHAAWGLTHWGEYVVGLDIASQATILADREKHPPLDYFTRVEGRRPDVQAVILGDEKAYLDHLVWDLAHGKTVYLARFLPGLDGPYHLRALGPLVEVGTFPQTPSKQDLPGVAGFRQAGGETIIHLLGYQVDMPDQVVPSRSLYVHLRWYAPATVPGNYQVHLRLVDALERVVWSAGQHPVNGMYPTAAWKPGEVVQDWFEVPLAESLLPGSYRLELSLRPPFSTQGLEYAEGQIWLPLRRIDVTVGSIAPRPLRPLRVVSPERWQLIGHDLPQQAAPSSRVTLHLYWQVNEPLPDREIGIRVMGEDGQGEWQWQSLGDGLYPTSQWRPGDTVITAHPLTMPAERDAAQVQVMVRLMGANDAPDRFSPGWLRPMTTVLSLPSVTLAGLPQGAPGAINFDDRILLLEANLSPSSLSPGQLLDVDVRWQCMRAMAEDYTLFVQLLSPDGTLKGQIDVWPQDGTHPTSQWRVGEEVVDRYQVRLQEGAPSGSYRVVIGWYLLKTMQRLPVRDAQGQAVDDHLLLPGPNVDGG